MRRIAIHPAFLLLVLLLELVWFVALCWWGVHVAAGAPIRILLAIAAPLAAAVLWGLFVAPKAKVRLPRFGRLAVQLLVFAAGAAAIYAIGQHPLAIVYAALVAIAVTIEQLGPRTQHPATEPTN